MNASPPAGPTVEVVQEEKTPSGTATLAVTTIAIIPAIFALVFHAGAAYMSYQRNQSFAWAILHFFLAVFYYPYYAFTQSSSAPAAAPAPTESSLLPTVQSAGRRLKKLLAGKRK
jgi:hypothetical protein